MDQEVEKGANGRRVIKTRGRGKGSIPKILLRILLKTGQYLIGPKFLAFILTFSSFSNFPDVKEI